MRKRKSTVLPWALSRARSGTLCYIGRTARFQRSQWSIPVRLSAWPVTEIAAGFEGTARSRSDDPPVALALSK